MSVHCSEVLIFVSAVCVRIVCPAVKHLNPFAVRYDFFPIREVTLTTRRVTTKPIVTIFWVPLTYFLHS